MIVMMGSMLVNFKLDDNLHRVHCDQGRIKEPKEVTEGKEQLLPFLVVFPV